MIRIIAVGKKHEDWVRIGIERYQTRVKKPWNIEWILLAHSSLEGLSARQDESRRILFHIRPGDYTILLDETGQQLTSPALSKQLLRPLERSQSVVMVVGGAYGVDETVQARADYVWSLSPLVFPHQLVRLMLVEQLYRAQEIAAGRPYHHQ